jgi:hypothetical protein
MTDSTTAEEQGKFLLTTTSSVSISMPEETSLSPIASTSDQHLPIFSLSTQNELISDNDDQLGSFQQEILPGPMDLSITHAMQLCRDTNNASRIILACTANTTFVDSHGPCMGRASKASLNKAIKLGYACVDSGATHDMSNGTTDDFMDYKPL